MDKLLRLIIIGIYSAAMVVLPVVHTHTLSHTSERIDGVSFMQAEQHHECPTCDFLASTAVHHTQAEIAVVSNELPANILPILVFFSVADAAVLPPCRAPPVCC